MSCKMFLAQVAATVMSAADPNAFVAAGQSESNANGFVRLPGSDPHYQRVTGYVEDVSEPDYHQACEGPPARLSGT